MKFGFGFANAGPFSKPENAAGLGLLLEELGFESLWTVEHVVVPMGYESEYPYSPDGKMPGGEHVPIPDPLIWLTYVGALTTTLRLGTGILILPQRNPVILAKEVATLDRLTRGRVELGIGVGWLEEEFDALGVPWARARRAHRRVHRRMRRLWNEPETEYAGEFTNFGALKSYPKPTSEGGPKIHIGGHTVAATRRAGRLGDGFFPGGAVPSWLRCSTRCARPRPTPDATPTRSRSRAAACRRSRACSKRPTWASTVTSSRPSRSTSKA